MRATAACVLFGATGWESYEASVPPSALTRMGELRPPPQKTRERGEQREMHEHNEELAKHELTFTFFTKDPVVGKVVAMVVADLVNKAIEDAADKGLVVMAPAAAFPNPDEEPLKDGEVREELYGFGNGLININDLHRKLEPQEPDEIAEKKPQWTFPKPPDDQLHR